MSLTQLAPYEDAASVLMFDSIRGEPDTAEWKRTAAAQGKRVFVPEDRQLPRRVDLVVVPGVAFDVTGTRLGQGGGWYDRYLAATPTSRRIGVCFEVQIAEWLPRDAHDVPVEAIITEHRVITVAPPDR